MRRTYAILMKYMATPQTSRMPMIAPTFKTEEDMLSWMFGARGRMTPKKTKVSASSRTHVAVIMSMRPEVPFIARLGRGLSFKVNRPTSSSAGGENPHLGRWVAGLRLRGLRVRFPR